MSPGLSLHQNLNYIQKLLNSYLVWLGVNTLNNDIWLVAPSNRSVLTRCYILRKKKGNKILRIISRKTKKTRLPKFHLRGEGCPGSRQNWWAEHCRAAATWPIVMMFEHIWVMGIWVKCDLMLFRNWQLIWSTDLQIESKIGWTVWSLNIFVKERIPQLAIKGNCRHTIINKTGTQDDDKKLYRSVHSSIHHDSSGSSVYLLDYSGGRRTHCSGSIGPQSAPGTGQKNE